MTDEREVLLGELRDAAAQDRLLVVTGAGVSFELQSRTGQPLPGWGELVETLRHRLPVEPEPAQKRLLDQLLPPGLAAEVHGDALIEAAQIIRQGYANGDFEKEVASLCMDAEGQSSAKHDAITELAPAGIITFNYDRAHEVSLAAAGRDYQKLLYSDHEDIKAYLAARGPRKPFLLKAHGTIEKPETLVLTSSSYRTVLSDCRPYRLFLQHALVSYTILIIGFGMRDRDFDELLQTLEVELGAPVTRHVFMDEAPKPGRDGQLKSARLAALTARFGVFPLLVDSFEDQPRWICSIVERPGPGISELAAQAISDNRELRQAAHDRMELLGRTGRRQLRAALIDASHRSPEPKARAELIYSLGRVADGLYEVAEHLLEEIVRSVELFSRNGDLNETECVAHALIAIRRTRAEAAQRQRLHQVLDEPVLKRRLGEMDASLRSVGRIPRLAVYAEAALAEVEARAMG